MKIAVLACAGVVASAGATRADTYQFTIDPKSSAMTYTVHNSVDIVGTLIGNYDPESNPGGTQTRKGLFGGQGNQAIPYTMTASVDGSGKTAPGGGLRMALDIESLTVGIAGLELDMLNGAAPKLPLSVALSFDTFRTFNPDSLYLGGSFPPIEIGEAELTALSAVQSGAGGGVLQPQGNNTFIFDAVVESQVTVAMTVLGQEVAPEPQPAPLALQGTVVLKGETATVSITLNQEIKQDVPLEGVSFENVPVDLPTVLPPGQVAHLLFSGDVTRIVVDMAFELDLSAVGERVCPVDFDGNGVLDLFDFLAFQNAFAAKDPGADFNGDGVFDLFDFLAFVNAFNAGC